MKYRKFLILIWLSGLLTLTSLFAHAQNGIDANTLLLLRFENSANGEQGETPTLNTGTSYEAGILGQGILVDANDVLRYATADNFNASAGTIEFWVKPRWGGNSANNYGFWGMGSSVYANGSLLLERDGGKNLTYNVNVPHGLFFTNVSTWAADQWHHIAVTWSFPGNMKMYVDGQEKYSRPSVSQDIISSVPASMTVGGFNAGRQANAVIDELRISNIARTAQEIYARYVTAVSVNSISLNAATTNLWRTWKITPTITGNTNVGTANIPASLASWTSSNSGVATVNANGQIVGVAAGTATLTATFNGAQASINVNVRAPILEPRINQLDSFLTTPAAGSLNEIPVVTIRYLPTTDGVNLDTAYAPDFNSLNPISIAALEQTLDAYDKNIKFALEEGSRFRGYGSQSMNPALGYRVVASITVYEPTPPGSLWLNPNMNPAPYQPEHHQIFERLNVQNYIENLGVKEIWFWQGGLDSGAPSYNPNIHLRENFRIMAESNMASPVTGDISNSYRESDDLPIYNKSYVVYGQNFRRNQAEAIHNHGHQLEKILEYANQLQTGNTQLFWQNFVGLDSNSNWQRGRAGDTHHPPNAGAAYDYLNTNTYPSDIADWNPSGGTQTPFSANTYGNVAYSFPIANPPSATETKWYIFWFQSMPGRGNQIPFGATNRMTNWWQFTADWDAAIRAGIGLYESSLCSYSISANNQNIAAAGGTGSVTVNAGSGCKWFASSNAAFIRITSGDTSNNGNTVVNFSVAPNSTGGARSGTISIAGQTFTITQTLAPTAASVSVAGRVLTADGDGVRNARVTLIDNQGNRQTILSGKFGAFRFENVAAGRIYIVSVAAKRFTFDQPAQVRTVNENLEDVNFTANENAFGLSALKP